MRKCADCQKRIGDLEAPWAFPLADMRFDEKLRFCSEQCLNAYEVEHGSPPSSEEKP